MTVLYTDYEPYVCHWTEELVAAGQLPSGEVRCVPVQQLTPAECGEFTHAHFFNGIGGWPLALELAGWPSTRSVWTGSCPCQPLSAAGKGQGADDARHVWPDWFRLIEQCRPPTIFGEQVASSDGRDWLAAVRTDLESLGYRVGAADLCAAGIGAPHLRQRLFWVADATHVDGWSGEREAQEGTGPDQERGRRSASSSAPRAVGEPSSERLQDRERTGAATRPTERARDANPWEPIEWIECLDGVARPTRPGVYPLAHGIPERVGRLRAYGNAIVPQVAAMFVRAFLDATA